MSRSMRSRLLWSTSAIALVVVAVFGVASAVLFANVARREARARLEAQAAQLVVTLADRLISTGVITEADLENDVPTDTGLIFRVDVRTYTSNVMPSSPTLQASTRGPNGTFLTLVADARPVDRRIHDGWRLIALIGAATVLGAIGLGAVQSRRLTKPLRQLEVAARRSADGLGASAPRAGIAEVDSIAEALDHSAQEIAAMVRSERAFSANASHQLRSPLTAMALRLELITESTDAGAAAEARAALDELHGLDRRIDEMLRFARTGRMAGRTAFDLVPAVRHQVEAHTQAFAAAGRRLTAEYPARAMVDGTPGAVDEVLDVLLDNALRHGRGTVSVGVRPDDGRVDLVITDEGRFLPDTPGGHGVGLVLARNLLRPDGGTIELVAASPTTFRVRLNGAPTTNVVP
jgi:signal transduction histidine kinase